MTESRGAPGLDAGAFDQTAPESRIGTIFEKTFHLAYDNRSKEEPTLGFGAGTRIATPVGYQPVETLAPGDQIITSTGSTATLRGVLRRPIIEDFCDGSIETRPIRILANAFEEGRPFCNLCVAPGSYIRVQLLGEMLVPLASLVNGASIAPDEAEHADYYELYPDAAAAVVADGLPIEAGSEEGLRPAAYNSGPVIEALRLRLAARFDMLGLILDPSPLADLHLLVDGNRSNMRIAGLVASAMIPVSARNVWLVSRATTPSTVLGTADKRLLGVRISALSIDDGLSPRRFIALDDPRLCGGFQEPEGSFRWTTGHARLPSSLWHGLEEYAYIRVNLAGPALPAWVQLETSALST